MRKAPTKRIFIDPYEDLGFAKLDLHREKRKGFPEVVYCEGKTRSQVLKIARRLYRSHGLVLMTRVAPGLARALKRTFPRGRHFSAARMFYLGKIPAGSGSITVLSAGTADIPVAEEASVTAEIMGSKVRRIYDVGVAGIHRLLAHKGEVDSSRVLIVVAGMDGVLASVVGGLFAKPIIAVPTSVGYGLSLKGLTPLLTMLNSCAPGIAVVNVDNGFGAGYLASIINRM